ncbi:MAG: DEAD/DEAH box helicase [Candidatus Heimdallarchaeaceae archaeon]
MSTDKFINHPLLKPNKVERRLYQETIFASCSRENSLVILPTGLGKTIIFILLVAHRLQLFPNGKVILCAPTKPLLDQHERTLKDLMNIPEDSIIQLSGQIDPSKRSSLWNSGKIFVCTPQTLQNDIIQKRVSLSEVVFLGIDEAHKAVGDHSYVFVVDQYMKLSRNPLVLGITASPGADLDKIQQIKDNLKVSNIEIRDDSSRDVKPYIHSIDEVWERVQLPSEFAFILKTLNGMFKSILIELKELGIISSSNPSDYPRRKLLGLKEIINQKYSNQVDSSSRSEYFKAMGLAGNSIRLSHAIELIETQGVPSLSKYFESQINDLRMGKGSQTLRNLIFSDEIQRVLKALHKLEEDNIIHPKLSKLKELVETEVRFNPDNRILVFAHYRVTAKVIAKELEKIDGVRVHWFVGQSSVRDKGLSQKEQIEIMQAFRRGDYNVLVSTSVAEEGLDIGECELVIFYDSVPSAIRLIQRKGRTGRRKKGKVILLIAEGTRDEGYFWASKRQLKKMKGIVNELQNNKQSDKQRDLTEFFADSVSDTEPTVSSESKIHKDLNKEVESTKPKSVVDVPKGDQVSIIVDSREKNSTIVKHLINKGVSISFSKLDFGDYVCSDHVIIERKEKSDFINSIMDKRLFSQVKQLVEVCSNPIIILEGDFSIFKTSLHPHATAGAIASIATDFKIPIIYTNNQEETAEILYAIAKREQIERKRSISISMKKGIGLKHQLEQTLTTFPNVDYRIAKRILKKFGSLKQVVNAKREEFIEVQGIGEKIADELIEYIYSNYNEIETGEDIGETIENIEWLKKELDKKKKSKGAK